MDDYGEYEYMRTIGTIPLSIVSYFSDWIRPELTCHWCNAADMVLEFYNNLRCAYQARNITTIDRVGLQNVLPPQSGQEAWNKLVDLAG